MALPRVVTTSPSAFTVPGFKQVRSPEVFASGLTLAAGTIVAKNNSTNLFGAYLHGASNAMDVPVGILAQNIDTSTAGNGANKEVANVYLGGGFLPSALTGTDAYYVAAAVTAGYGWFVNINGTLVLPS